jgi:branched-chain amino acid transport system permease protein
MTRESRVGNMSLRNRNPLKGEKRGGTVRAVSLVLGLYIAIKAASFFGFINEYWQIIIDQSLIMAIGALGLSIIYGFAGQFSLGHAAFYGIGAYTAGVIGRQWGRGNMAWFFLALLAGTVVPALISLLIGVPILRLRSDYLGIATLGFGQIVRVLLNNADKVYPPLGGATGMTGVPQVARFDIILALSVLVVMLVRNLVTSTYGRSWVAIREDELAANAMGIDPTRSKLLGFVIGCGLAGLAGALYAYRYPYLHPSSFELMKSLDFLLIVVLGGLGSISGTLVTSVAFVFLLEVLRMALGQAFVDWRGVIYAVILVVTILLRPQGLFAGKEFRLLGVQRSHDPRQEVEKQYVPSGD